MARPFLLALSILLGTSACGLLSNDVDLNQYLPGTWVSAESHNTEIEPFLAVGKNGMWLASDGCNIQRGTWTTERGITVTAEEVVQPDSCDGLDLPGIFLKATDIEFTEEGWLVLDGETTLRPSFGAPAMETPAAYLGVWGEEGSDTNPMIVFNEDGTFTGFDGCNYLSGKYTHDFGVMDLGPMSATKKSCEGVDTWMSTSVSAYLHEGSLGFFMADGTLAGTLAITSQQ